MGSQESKVEEQPPEEDESKETPASADSVPSTPILTPLDPRSPSANIARTPLELVLGSKICENTPNVKNENEIKDDSVDLVLGVDPRSPTIEFNRTPIIVAAVTKEKSHKLQNKNLDNVRKLFLQTTPTHSIIKHSKIIPPKLLGSSPISPLVESNKRKSLVGLLETNIDFTETNLDNVCKAKSSLNNSLPLEINEDCITPPMNQLKHQVETLQITSEDSSDLAPKHLLTLKINEENVTPKENSDKNKQTNGFDDKTPEEKPVNITAKIKDFDKKLSNLIYQDNTDDDNKAAVKTPKFKENNRTPLGVRNSNDEPRKSTHRLKVSDKPRKSEGSRIPVLKDNHGKKIDIQCENTPPSSMQEKKIKPKLSQWDADKTLVI